MNIAQTVVYSPIRALGRTLCRVHDEELARIPHQGPLLIVANHVNFLDVPIFYTHLIPRSVTGFAKIETWKNPAIGLLFSLGGAIPIRRGVVDRTAFGRARDALRAGRILAIAPEGTRSGDGRLQKAQTGVSVLALESGAPVLPVAYYGGENFRRNIVRLVRTDFHFRVGTPFRVRLEGGRPTREARENITADIMYRLAALMPPEYRGHYADLSKATNRYLVDSNDCHSPRIS
ncbi:MAG: 1-acyl-sn-glycerol-3-phosphate acyltransferase [Anaerolineales bacterium]|nr:1-acyl-sn-glycerol-3-phosphate acyltransferase [Anaerolineales bacterium]